MGMLDHDYEMSGADNIMVPRSIFIAVRRNGMKSCKCLPQLFAAHDCRFAELRTSRVSCPGF